MNKRPLLALAPVAAAVAIAGCGGGGRTSSSPAPSVATPAAPSGTSVTLHRSRLGDFLADGKGRTLYMFVADRTGASTCYSACASLWPPLTTSGAVKAGTGVHAALLGTSKRTDDKLEVNYAGHPLYYYAGDSKPGDTTGQAINQFGALWYLLAPGGTKIRSNGH